MEFNKEKGRIIKEDENGKLLAEITFPGRGDGVVVINHTYVDDSLRGQGIAGQLVDEAYKTIKADGDKAILTCPYAVKWFADRPDKGDIVVTG